MDQRQKKPGQGRPGSFGNKPAEGRKPFGGKPAGESRGLSDRPRRPFGDKPAAVGAKPAAAGPKPAGGEHKPFGAKPAAAGPKPAGGEHKPFGAKPAAAGPKSAGGEHKPFGAKPAAAGPKPAGGEHKPFGAKPAAAGPKPAAGERKLFGGKPASEVRGLSDRPRRPFGDKPAVRPRPAAPVKPAEPEGLASRRLALLVLCDVLERGGWASICLNARLTKAGLSPEDRRLVTRLVYDTLQHLVRIDYALDQLMARPDTAPRLKNILRLGACQILLEDRIPDSAACNISVMLCRENELDELAGVCNGILRNLIRRKEEGTLCWPDPVAEPDLARAVRYSAPLWLVQRLTAEWDAETADALLSAPWQESITIRPNLTRLDDAAFERLLAGKVWQREPGLVPHAVRIRGMADLGSDADFARGSFSIEGEGSMLACYAVAPKPGWQVLDACAAPGGKSCLLAELMNGTGRVQAWELHEHRTALITAQAKRLGLENVRPITRDATIPRPDMAMTMDAVLLDAPCSGLGNLADKPDMRLRLKPENIEELIGLQRRLLDACAPCVKVGGTLVYSTCSILKSENERQVAAFLERHPEFELMPLPETFPAALRALAKPDLQLLPHRDGMSGFYIARLRRVRR